MAALTMHYQQIFNLNDPDTYSAWRAAKLKDYPVSIGELLVSVKDINHLSSHECQQLTQVCMKTNMVIYRSMTPLSSKLALRDTCTRFGLKSLDMNLYSDDDGISALQVSAEKRQFEYIPYSDKAIKWHTDGYYNSPENKICAMVLHCVTPALQGGENQYLDHEIVYTYMRDENPEYIEALMQEDAMTIPANIENGVEIRPAQAGPVFSIDPQTGHLHMRYTARTRSITWKDDTKVREAVSFLEHLLSSDLPYIFNYRLLENEGILSNNVLHTRTEFMNGVEQKQQRLVYRARYHERMSSMPVNNL